MLRVNPKKPDCAHPIPEDGLNLINLNGDCGTTLLAGELVDGFTFEPRCLVLVLAAASERAMFDEMVAAGRTLYDPFEIQVNYSVATGAAPDIKTVSTNCGLSRVLLDNYHLDATGQAERDELEQVCARTSRSRPSSSPSGSTWPTAAPSSRSTRPRGS